MLVDTDSRRCDFIGLDFSFEDGYLLEFEYEPYGEMCISFDHAWFYRQIKYPSSALEQGIFCFLNSSLLSLVYEKSYETLPLKLAKHFRIVSSGWLIDFIVSVSPSFRTDKKQGLLQKIAIQLTKDDCGVNFISGAIQYDESEKYDTGKEVSNKIKAPIELRSLVLKSGSQVKFNCEIANKNYYELSVDSAKFLQIIDELLFNMSLEKIQKVKPAVGSVYRIYNSTLFSEIVKYSNVDSQYRIQGANDTVDILADSMLIITTKE